MSALVVDPTEWKVRPYDEGAPNERFIDIPYGYIEIGGVSRSKRDAIAEFIVEACKAYAARKEIP